MTLSGLQSQGQDCWRVARGLRSRNARTKGWLLESAFTGGFDVFRSLLLGRIFGFFRQAELAKPGCLICPLARCGIDLLIQAMLALSNLGVALLSFRSDYGHFLDSLGAAPAENSLRWLAACQLIPA